MPEIWSRGCNRLRDRHSLECNARPLIGHANPSAVVCVINDGRRLTFSHPYPPLDGLVGAVGRSRGGKWKGENPSLRASLNEATFPLLQAHTSRWERFGYSSQPRPVETKSLGAAQTLSEGRPLFPNRSVERHAFFSDKTSQRCR